MRTIGSMELTVGDRPVRPLTADEVLRMVEAGLLSEDERVELLHGVLTAVSPKSPAHEAVKTRLIAWLSAGVAAGRYLVRVEAPIAVPDPTSLPEPDLAVVAPGIDVRRHPATALLVIEVALTSQRVDTQIKPALYAAARIPEFWVVDVPARRVVVHTEPSDGRFAVVRAVPAPERLAPAAIEAEPVPLGALLAGI